jgi:hypothetical protein
VTKERLIELVRRAEAERRRLAQQCTEVEKQRCLARQQLQTAEARFAEAIVREQNAASSEQRYWPTREDAHATTKAGLDQGRDQGWVRLLHASVRT